MNKSKYDNESETTNHTARSYTTHSMKQRSGVKTHPVDDDHDDNDHEYSHSSYARTQQSNSRYTDRNDRNDRQQT